MSSSWLVAVSWDLAIAPCAGGELLAFAFSFVIAVFDTIVVN
jgi:hypothetical protein